MLMYTFKGFGHPLGEVWSLWTRRTPRPRDIPRATWKCSLASGCFAMDHLFPTWTQSGPTWVYGWPKNGLASSTFCDLLLVNLLWNNILQLAATTRKDKILDKRLFPGRWHSLTVTVDSVRGLVVKETIWYFSMVRCGWKSAFIVRRIVAATTVWKHTILRRQDNISIFQQFKVLTFQHFNKAISTATFQQQHF